MRDLAGDLRVRRIQRKPFLLKDFRSANLKHKEKLAAAKTRNIDQILKRGATPQDREEPARCAGITIDAILEFVQLSDLVCIPRVKGINAQLYVDAGVDNVEKMAGWDPVELTELMGGFVERTGFAGMPTLPAEARFTVKKSQGITKICSVRIKN